MENIESLVGPVSLVGAVGLPIARLTRPRMRLGFSESAVVAPYEGGRALMFRMVNLQPGELSDVQVRGNLIWFEEVDGVRERSFHQLALERSSVEFFTLHWTVVHPITADSPLRNMTPESLASSQAEFLIEDEEEQVRVGMAKPGMNPTRSPAATWRMGVGTGRRRASAVSATTSTAKAIPKTTGGK